jgi:hypothetical protein
MGDYMASSFSRRSFFALTGVTAAGLGLAGCGPAQPGNTPAATGVEPQDGSPANTPLDQLPLPEAGKTYNNPKSRDEVQDGGTLTQPITEIGPQWNYYSLQGNTSYMNILFGLINPRDLFYSNVEGSKFEANKNYVKDYKVEDKDGKQVVTLTFTDQAKFNDGTEIDWTALQTAYICLSGQNEAFEVSSTDGYDKIESVEQGDNAKTAVITMKEPVYPVEQVLGYALHPKLQDPEFFNKGYNSEPNNELGAGPYIVDSFDDTQATFKPNPKWWGDAPKLDTLIFKQMDTQAQINAFKNGEVDTMGAVSMNGSAEVLSNFNSMADAQVRRGLGNSIAVIEINSTRGVLQDIAVRKAFCQVVDAPTIVSIVFQGVNWKEEAPGSMLWPYWAAGYDNNLPEDVKSLKNADERKNAAKKTLEDAGYKLNGDFYEKDGQQVTFAYTMFGDATTVKNRAAAIQKMCKDAGINLTLDSHPSSEFSSVLSSGNWDVCLFGWSGTPTSYNNGVQLYGSESPSNFGHQGTAETDALFAKVVSTADFDERMKIMNEAEKKCLATYSYLPVYTGPSCFVCKKGLANYGPALFLDVPSTDIGWQK